MNWLRSLIRIIFNYVLKLLVWVYAWTLNAIQMLERFFFLNDYNCCCCISLHISTHWWCITFGAIPTFYHKHSMPLWIYASKNVNRIGKKMHTHTQNNNNNENSSFLLFLLLFTFSLILLLFANVIRLIHGSMFIFLKRLLYVHVVGLSFCVGFHIAKEREREKTREKREKKNHTKCFVLTLRDISSRTHIIYKQ